MTQAIPSSSMRPSTSAAQALRTSYGLHRSYEPLYSGGASTAISSDGRYLFAPVNDEVQVTHLESGSICAKIPSDMEEITCLALAPDQSMLVVASRSTSLRIFSISFPRSENGAVNGSDADDLKWSLQRTIAKTHDAPAVIMRIDPTSTLVATGSSDTTAKVWDLRGGFCTHVFRGHGGVVSSLAWNMPSALLTNHRQIELFTGSIDGRIRHWDLKKSASGAPAKAIATLDSHYSVVRGLDISKDGQRMISAGRDRMLAFWERKSKGKDRSIADGNVSEAAWRVVETIAASEALESAGFLEDGDTFWTAGSEGELRLWSFVKRGLIRLQPGGRFATGRVQKRAVEDQDREAEEDETRAVTEVHYLRHSAILITVHADQDFIFRSAKDLSRTKRLAGFTDQVIDALILSPESDRPDSHLAVATNSTAIRVYHLSAGTFSVDVLPEESGAEEGHTGLILCLDKTSDGKWLASGGKDRTVRIWAYVPQRREKELVEGLSESDEEIGVPVNDSARPSTQPATPMVWACVAIAEGHTESVGALAFARRPAVDAQNVSKAGAPFLVSGSQDRTAKIWDLSKLEQHVIDNFTSPNGARKALALASLTTLKIHDKDINALDVSPNNALLLTGSQDRSAKIFAIEYQAPSKANMQKPTAALKLVTSCAGHKRGIWSVAFSPSDAVFLTASSDRTMKLWSINDNFTCVKTYVGHTNSVLRARFLRGSKGLQCISCASDGLVKVWNVRTEECLDTLDGHEERVWGLDCTRDGAQIISAGANGVVRFWQDETAKRQEEELQKRQVDVEQEQTLGNLLAVRDYRNAISLSLAMQQPKRLFELFKIVDQQRSGRGDSAAADATAALMQEAFSSNDAAAATKSSIRDPALADVLARAGVLPSSAKRALRGPQIDGNGKQEAASITGLTSVDQVIASLQPAQLATLLTFVRDWNTTVRTANVAQTVLHAILRFHSADSLIEAFESQKRGKNQQDSVAAAFNQAAAQAESRSSKRSNAKTADLANVLDALLPYTRRHYDRAQRILTESAMVEYTLANMDAVLGIDDDQDEKTSQVATNGIATNGKGVSDDDEDSDVSMHSDDDTE